MKVPEWLRLYNYQDEGDINYWRLKLLNVFLIIIFGVFLFFTFFNSLVAHRLSSASFDFIGMILTIAVFRQHNVYKNIQQTINLTLLLIAATSLGIIIVSPKDFGIIMWSIFFPIFSMFLKGRKVGLYFTLAYLGLLLTYLYNITGDEISDHYFFEVVMVQITLLAVIYYYEASRSQAYKQLQLVSIEDPLTSLYNRRYFNRIFEEEINRARRQKTMVSFFIMDVDHFKEFNDIYGHLKGDDALQAISKILKGYMRRGSDYAFRIGGEEFAGVITGMQQDDTLILVENIRHAIEDLEIRHEGNEAYQVLTSSFGLIVVDEWDGLDARSIYKRADEALYQAKSRGRNLTVLADVTDMRAN